MERDSIPLWKLVLGVALGVLLADLIRMVTAAMLASAVLTSWGYKLDGTGQISAISPAPTEPRRPPTYDGPLTAGERSSSRACINGTIVDRSGNGWSQVLADSRPQPCRARSP